MVLQIHPLFQRALLLTFCLLTASLIIERPLRAQPGSANVLYADHPLPIRIGIEVGATYTTFQNATPSFFPTEYPYSPIADTIHAWFPSGYKAGIGLHLGVAADFAISRYWGILAKVNYNERRGSWNATTSISGIDSTGNPINVPLTNDMTLILRYLSVEVMARYSFKSLDWFYLGAGLSADWMTSNNYTITQTLGGPSNISFVDEGTGSGTGIRKYSLTNSFGSVLNRWLGEVKVLAGFPIMIGHRWSLNPEVTIGIPFTQLMSSGMHTAYQKEGLSSTPNPLTFAGILALRYEL